MKKYKLLIFDMDGLMVRTGDLAYKGFIESAKKNKFIFNREVFYQLAGRTEQDIIKRLGELYGEAANQVVWRKDMDQFRNSIFDEEQRVYLKDGMMELLEVADKLGYKMVVASSNKKERIEKYLKIEGISHFFETIISSEDIKKGKPAPEIFLKAAMMLNCVPVDALVFEDSVAGVQAAIAGGFDVVHVPDILSENLGKTVIGIPYDKEMLESDVTFTQEKQYNKMDIISEAIDLL